MSPIDFTDVVWAVCLGLPLSFFAFHIQRMRGATRRIVLVAEDLVELLAQGDFARASSRLEEVGGDLGRDVQGFLVQLLAKPWVGAGEAVRIADTCVARPRVRAVLLAGILSIPVAVFVGLVSRDRAIESQCQAVTLFGLISVGCGTLLPNYADACKVRIIRALLDVQRAAEAWLSAHGKDSKPI